MKQAHDWLGTHSIRAIGPYGRRQSSWMVLLNGRHLYRPMCTATKLIKQAYDWLHRDGALDWLQTRCVTAIKIDVHTKLFKIDEAHERHVGFLLLTTYCELFTAICTETELMNDDEASASMIVNSLYSSCTAPHAREAHEQLPSNLMIDWELISLILYTVSCPRSSWTTAKQAHVWLRTHFVTAMCTTTELMLSSLTLVWCFNWTYLVPCARRRSSPTVKKQARHCLWTRFIWAMCTAAELVMQSSQTKTKQANDSQLVLLEQLARKAHENQWGAWSTKKQAYELWLIVFLLYESPVHTTIDLIKLIDNDDESSFRT